MNNTTTKMELLKCKMEFVTNVNHAVHALIIKHRGKRGPVKQLWLSGNKKRRQSFVDANTYSSESPVPFMLKRSKITSIVVTELCSRFFFLPYLLKLLHFCHSFESLNQFSPTKQPLSVNAGVCVDI